MKVRTRKARINRALARELWLTPHLKKVASFLIRENDRYAREGKLLPYNEEAINKLFEEVINNVKR